MTVNKKLATMIHLAADELFAHDLIDGEKISYRDLLEASRIVGATSQARDAQPTHGELPPLPEPIGEVVGRRLTGSETEFFGYFRDGYTTDEKQRVYTPDQMREYGALCRAAPNGGPSREVVARIVVTKSGAVVESWGMLPPPGEYALCRCDAPAQPVQATAILDWCAEWAGKYVKRLMDTDGYHDIMDGEESLIRRHMLIDARAAPWSQQAPAQPDHIETNPDDALIDAAVARGELYDGDSRDCIKTDVINAFYVGAAFQAGRASLQAAPPETNFCARCGKRLFEGSIHTCTPPAKSRSQPPNTLPAKCENMGSGAADKGAGPVSSEIINAITAYGDARADGGDSGAAIGNVIRLLRIDKGAEEPSDREAALVEALTRLRNECDLEGLRSRAGFDCWLNLADSVLEHFAASPQGATSAHTTPARDDWQTAMATRLLKAVYTIAHQAGGDVAELVDWLTNDGGLVKCMMAHVHESVASLKDQQAAPVSEQDKLDAKRYRRIRENWIDCEELGMHGRTVVVDMFADAALERDAAIAGKGRQE